MLVVRAGRRRACGRPLARAARADRAAARTGASLGYTLHRLPRQQHPAGAPRRAGPQPRPRRGRGHQPDDGPRARSSSSGSSTPSWSWPIAAGRDPRPAASAGSSTSAVLLGARLRDAAGRRPRRSGSPPTACPAPTGSTAFIERWPRVARARPAAARRPRGRRPAADLAAALVLSVARLDAPRSSRSRRRARRSASS